MSWSESEEVVRRRNELLTAVEDYRRGLGSFEKVQEKYNRVIPYTITGVSSITGDLEKKLNKNYQKNRIR